MKESVYDNKIIKSVRDFTEKPYFPVIVGAAALLFYCLRLPITALLVLGVPVLFTLFFNDDTRPALGVAMLAVLTVRYKHMLSAYTSAYAIAVYAVLGAGIIAAMVCRYFFYGFIKSEKKVWQGMLLVCVAIVIGGAFGEYWSTFNIASGLGMGAVMLGVSLVFGYTMRWREDNLVYLCRVLAVAAVVIAAELVEFYIVRYQGEALDSAWKGEIVIGWGLSNLIGEMLTFTLPAIFYLAGKEKHGYLYNLVAVVALVAIYFTLGRNALLWAALVTVGGVLTNCFVGNNKRSTRVCALVLAALFVAAVVVMLCSGYLARLMKFFTDTGFSDRGRFRLWKEWLEFFKQSPLLGQGVAAHRIIYPNAPLNAHNTLIQMLGGCGLMGTVLYLYHRAQTVELFIKKPSFDRIYVGATVIAGVGMSLIDPLFFQVYFAMFYAAVLTLIEKDRNEAPDSVEKAPNAEQKPDGEEKQAERSEG